MRIRVLWLIKGLGAGGAENLLVHQAAVRDRNAFDVHVAYAVPDRFVMAAPLRDQGIDVRCLTGRYPLSWLVGLWRATDGRSVDIVHTHSPLLAAAVRLLGRLHRRRPRLISTEHNSWPAYSTSTRWANRLTFTLDDAHLAVSDAARDSIPARRRALVEVIRHGVQVDAIGPSRARRATTRAGLGIAQDEIVAITVANYRVHKDYPNLFAAARLACAQVPALRFVVIGQGPLADEIEAMVRDSHLGERFVLLGAHDDVNDLLAAADMFVLASRQEGRPVALMEALVIGLPVAVTAAGGVPEMVTDGREGRVVPIEDPSALAGAIASIAESAEQRVAFSLASADTGTGFDIRRAQERIEQIYRELVSADGTRPTAHQ